MTTTLATLARRVLALPLAALAPRAPQPRPAGAGPTGQREFARLLRTEVAVGKPAARRFGRADASSPERHDPGANGPCGAGDGSAAAAPLPVPLPPAALVPPSEVASAQERAAVALQQLWPALVRKVAWDGDSRRASMRLELGAGALAGAVLLLHCDDGRVHVKLSDPRGADLDAWRARIATRLVAAGLQVDGVE